MPDASATIPDPTSDLSWSTWHGAIHERFAQNATGHPDRICATETTPLREFTYRQMNAASNVLAQYLVKSGISRGDVVMIYAFRNVDLIIAIMGTLKAGATFSVLDPAYPPDRQIVYLDVSRPRGLVILSKAQGGGLSVKVEEWISNNLRLKARVPNLRLQDDGQISGDEHSGRDLFDNVRHLQATMPHVVVGPDSNPTLSFTSGSEGRPKGVLGRHFSLMYYQPWMAKRFGLSDNDRFTMLSGISHDPIQRDIFTTLYLGARILIPSQEDIQHEKLAEWMKKWKCTVTHLTPAMGQILVGGTSTEFPDLRNAFFVGDILIKRDVRRLRDLAPNCQAINMFGTTETQRAVSYYLIPSRTRDPDFLDKIGERIPAGKGMHDVQLLVVDRQNPQRICSVKEQGEIYVRASGLAEGYLGLEDLTREKFVPSWFVENGDWIGKDLAEQKLSSEEQPWREFYKGPRDRLYRSGDLGHYDENGDVECTGRADNQVKIRGFRIELGEIDSHLSQHPVVRENVTLVRRDKDEEHILVSYIVPELSVWPQWLERKGLSDKPEDKSMSGMLNRFAGLRDDLRTYLGTKLPNYAVPNIIIPLNRMPLNPNGKVDRPALPFPNPEELSAALPRRSSIDAAARSDTEASLAEIWGRILQIPSKTIGPDDSFFDLGAHSLSAQRMLFELRKKYSGLDVLIQSIYEYPTLREFSAEVDRALDPRGRMLDFESEVALHQEEHYSLDAKDLAKNLPDKFGTRELDYSKPFTVFLTGATGFLGAFVLANLLNRTKPLVTVIAHVRARNVEEGQLRLRKTCVAYGVWSNAWESRLRVVTGNLEEERLGIATEKWKELQQAVDVVIANGARVHWVSPYKDLKAANVLSTLKLIDLAAEGKPKQVTFVSSTAVLGTDHYTEQSVRIVESGGNGILEDDDLEGSRKGLDTGYGQSKWSSEYLMRQAGKRGLVGAIVRPGYVLGHSGKGTTITDDFLIRMLKGCLQLQKRPNIPNSINMVPVDHVANIVAATAIHPPVSPLGVAQVTSHPRLTFNSFLGSLETYGYSVALVEYPEWSKAFEDYVGNERDHALERLFHFVTSDLPAHTRPVELDDRNAASALDTDAVASGDRVFSKSSAVTEDLIGKYLSYLVKIGFIVSPTEIGQRSLPDVEITQPQLEAIRGIEGRGAVSS